MEGDKHKPIETGADRLLILVNETTQITLGQAARHLAVSEDIVDDWSNALEQEGLVRTKLTWREKYLQSTSFKEDKRIWGLFPSGEKPNARNSIKKRLSIERKINFLNKRLKYLKSL